MSSRGSERGSTTVFVMVCLTLLVLIAAALGLVSAMFVAHRQAQTAADLAALAAARALASGGSGCPVARRVAEANRAQLARCAVEGVTVSVEVTVAGPRWLGRQDELLARARAGPV